MNEVPYQPQPRYFNIVKLPIIGESVSLVNTLLDCYDQITIGDYVSFGHDCQVLTGYHDMFLRGKERQDTIKHAPVTIGNGVWIASRVTICPGVTIGDNAVVGAGSIVLKDIPANEFWCGIPAKYEKSIL
ncbi:MAG: acyltransferase [Candidatus Scalindua sp.]|nr:acyltransferase [Candidatus Scalindua sp.]